MNQSGTCCSTVVGAKGIGKTECLLNFMHLANRIVPNVVVVYVDFSGVDDDDCIFRKEPLSAALCREVTKYGVRVAESGPIRPQLYRVLDALQTAHLRVLLLVDELDQLYRCQLNPEMCSVNSPSWGRSELEQCLSCCAGHRRWEQLVSANASPLAKEEFQLLRCGVPNLNDTKYKPERVYSVTPVDLEALASILGMECSQNRRPFLRLVAYRTGCNPRSVQRLMDETRSGVPPELSLGENTVSNPAFRQLRHTVLKLLWSVNQSLLADIFGGNGGKSEADVVQAICTTEWETKLLPVSYLEVEKAWKTDTKLSTNGELQPCDVLYGVLLVDRGLLAFDGVEHGAPSRIYPCSLESLIGTSVSETKRQSIWRQSQSALRDAATVSGTMLANPTAVARMAAVAASQTMRSPCNIA